MKRFSSYLSAALTVLLITLSVLPASAATPTSSSGLSITPRKNYTIQPGNSVTDKLTIGNLSGTADLNITLKMLDFTFTDQSGTPKLFLGANAPQTSWSLKPFTTLPKTVLVPAGETKSVNYTISVPKNQGAGSYYSAIEYQASGANGGNVSLNASGVSLVFVSIPGTVKESMTLQKFGAYTSDASGVAGKFIFIATGKAPQQLGFAIKNAGNVAEAPAGNIILKDMFGHQVTTINNANPTSSLALLGQNRLFLTCIKTAQQQVDLNGQTTKADTCANPGLKPGRYTANLDVFYGQNGNKTNEITATATFWILPWWFIVTVVIILLIIIGGIWWLQRKIRSVVKGTSYKASRGISRRRG